MGIKNSALCNFCNQEEDSILHYLWGCPVAKRFWTSFNIWLSSALDLEVFELSPKETVLGISLTSLFNQFEMGEDKNEITYSQFIQSVKQGDVSSVTISPNNLIHFTLFSVQSFYWLNKA
jgi:hypothetical protein